MLYRAAYTLLFSLLLPFIVLRLLWRSIKAPGYRKRTAERFGFFKKPHWRRSSIWIHSVSVGETLAAVPLIKALQAAHPDTPLVITTTTPTGSAQVVKLFADEIAQNRILHVYSPYDAPFFINQFLNRVRPKTLILMETELWPNMLHCCGLRGISIVLANGRLSEKSLRGYQRITPLIKNALHRIYAVAAQFNNDGDRFIQLGLTPERLHVTGSIKFDLDLSKSQLQQANKLKQQWSVNNQRLIFLAASTHTGEDEIILKSFLVLKKIMPQLLLVIVPRHPERFESIYKLCCDKKLNSVKFSAVPALTLSTDVVVADVMGQLLTLYGVCDIAFVGGSLMPIGGHNLIEPAAWGKPIVTGPHLHNFQDISQLMLDKNALTICKDGNELTNSLKALLENETLRLLMGKNALQVALHNRGALQKLLSLIDQAIKLWKIKYPSQPSV